ncbi:MAG: prepilin-type N-terminal cleavage/methylation domain-containing protein [Desulfobacterales bacterium]|nr:prepilin-type N-terminal cleavage/methylation domain-containing protein [Desulfobacterales bacterium]
MVNTTKKRSSQPHHYRPESKGFTLVEMVMTVIIVAIFSAIAFPLLMRWVPSANLKAATHELYANFQKAKLHAAKTNNDVTFSFTVVPDCLTPTSYTFTDEDGDVIVNKVMDSGVCIYFSDFANGTSGFDSRGLSLGVPPTPPEWTVRLKHLEVTKQYVINQSIAGNVTIQ